MFHQLVIRYFDAMNSKFLLFQNDVLITVLLFAVTLLLSHYSFIWFEKPANNYLKKSNTSWNSLFN